MPQKDMLWETFESIVDAIPEKAVTVSLQGEGEPSLHPRFFDMARYVREKKHSPYTIINGSRIDTSLMNELFPRFGVSVDSLDVAYSNEIGRHNLEKVMMHIQELVQVIDPGRITIMTTDMGQPLHELRAWVLRMRFGQHIVQKLSTKDDYARRYTIPITSLTPKVSKIALSCRFLEQRIARFYTWQGRELPCVFIKSQHEYVNVVSLRQSLGQGHISSCCSGCSHLVRTKPLSAAAA